jgi:hypothetical protein
MLRINCQSLVLLLCACLHAEAFADPKAAQIAQSMMTAMGGQDAWHGARFIRYGFRVNTGGKTLTERAHLWDKHTGRYRLESTTKEGASQVALFNTNDQQGAVYRDGKKLTGTAATEALKQAYGSFINDMYWLAMPWKWLDAGVNLKYLGKRNYASKTFDVVELSFKNVGLTPGDRYQAYVSPDSQLMEHWEYTLQSGNKGSWDWEYITTEGIKLASNHTNKEDRSINMANPEVLKSVDDAYFSDPGRKLSNLQ